MQLTFKSYETHCNKSEYVFSVIKFCKLTSDLFSSSVCHFGLYGYTY